MKKWNLIASSLLAIPLLLAGQAGASAAEVSNKPSQAVVAMSSVTEVNVNLDIYQNPIYDRLPTNNHTSVISYESTRGGISIDSQGRVIASSPGYYKVDVYYGGTQVYIFHFNVGPM
ncbi:MULTISPECIES: hypothetical protein [Brevibacillus]|uniref:hypothetical protein n=1 Tax=Brevibacillus TaxID=55080 RepID=UPI00156B05E1|nr:hypothetical protein [Brevibacillus sp. RS1.1]NRR02105.1 hypothetical protein [Brevibacillus sp. RS1.1]